MRRMAIAIGMLVLVAVFPACAAKPQRFEYARVCMGVKTRVVLYGVDSAAAERAAAGAFAEIGRLEAIMSDYRPDSEVSRLGDLAEQGGMPVSGPLYETLLVARGVSEASGGAFDVTVGPATRLWRMARRNGQLPLAARLESARARINWRDVAMTSALPAAGGRVMLLREGMQIDLGGIGKGYAAQSAVELLRVMEFPRCLVSLAGDVAVGDPPPGERGWRIEVRGERSESSEPIGVLLLRNGAVSTAGDAEQFIEIEGERYSHIVDPRTGLGSRRHVTATVVGPRGEIVDAIDTACCLVELDVARSLIEQYEGTAAAITEADGRVHVIDPRGILRWDTPPRSW